MAGDDKSLARRQVEAWERMATAMELLGEVAKSVNNALVTIAEQMDPDGDLPPEYRRSSPYARVPVDVQLPEQNSVTCQRCQTIQPEDPKHERYPAPHDCRPWVGPTGDRDGRQLDNAESDSWGETAVPPGMAYGPGTYDRPSSHSSWSPEPWEMR